MEPTTQVVNIEELGQTDDGYRDATWNGSLFSGIAFEEDEVTRNVIGVVGYRSGKLHGPLRIWDSSGRPRREAYYDLGGLHGPWRQWHDNGRAAGIAYFEQGFALWEKEWDDSGKLIKDVQMDERHPRWGRLEELRAKSKDGVVDIDLENWQFVLRPYGWRCLESELPSTLSRPKHPPPSRG